MNEKVEDIKGVFRSRKSKENRQYNDHKKKNKPNLQNTIQANLRLSNRNHTKIEDELRCSGSVGNAFATIKLSNALYFEYHGHFQYDMFDISCPSPERLARPSPQVTPAVLLENNGNSAFYK